MTAPEWAIGANPAVREIPGDEIQAGAPLSWQQVTAFVQYLLDSFIGRIAIAFGGIDIFGWQPLDFLAEWGEQRVQDAQDNYAAAINAQYTATYAVSGVTGVAAGALASDVSGGVAVVAQFNEAAGTTLGTGWTRVSDGPGAGTFGPNGSGQAVWNKSGGLWRRHVDVNDTPLATDYQSVYVVLAAAVEGPYLGGDAYTYLIARSDTSGSEFVWARIGDNDLAIGKTASGTFDTPWATTTVTTRPGDQWQFIVGTDSDDREMIVKQNNVVKLTHTDVTSSSYGASHLNCGIGSLASDRAVVIVPFLDQTRPAEIDLWAATDRESTTY